MKYFIFVFNLLLLLMAGGAVMAAPAEETVVELRFENRRFMPQTLNVPANRPFKIRIVNSSKEAIEFESFKINREKVVGPGETVTVNVPALKPGSYDFYDDFHRDVPEGTIVAK
ncbi:MAG TPA: cupredoxin domain-containing protein [Candidatus Binatia bacterium]